MHLSAAAVEDLLRIIRTAVPNEDAQLSILSYALVFACRACDVPKDIMLQTLNDLFEEIVAAEQMPPSLSVN